MRPAHIEAMRDAAGQFFAAGVAAADPRLAVRRAVTKDALQPAGRLFVIAIGKAAVPMIAELLALAPVEPARAIAVTNYDNMTVMAGVEIYGSGHPVPDGNGQRAAQDIAKLLATTTNDDLVVCLISGGGSALLPAPVAGVSLVEKIAVNEVLLKSGCDITEMNLVRQNLSQFKGGGLGGIAAPAQVLSLILSDVPGDDLSIIASGPTAPAYGGHDAAIALIKRCNLWDLMPQSVCRELQNPDNPPPDLSHVDNRLIGSNRISVDAAMACADGYQSTLLDPWLEGDVADAAAKIFAAACAAPGGQPVALFCGGETSVVVAGTGKGGRNQELALRFADLASRSNFTRNWVFLSGGTDGRDGPTDAAGGVVDGETMTRIMASGADFSSLLANNDAYAALAAADDLLITGATGTNVADLQILLLSE